MTETVDLLDLLARLPVAEDASRLGVYVIDAQGVVRLHRGFDDGLPARLGDLASLSLPDARQWRVSPLRDGGLRLLTTFDGPLGDSTPGLLDTLAGLASEWLRLELDLEQISPSSLAMMEEVAMVHELTSRLPACASGSEVARLALEELMIAAEAERGYFIGFDRALLHGEIEVALQVTDGSRRPVDRPRAEGRTFELAGGLLERIACRGGSAVIQVVGESPIGRPGSPEATARREALAASVSYGDGDGARTIGAIVLCDKLGARRAFGSQESKMAMNVAALIGGAIGHRMVASLGKEIELARAIQRQILPDRVAAVPGFDMAGACETSGAVGGDYFDFVPMADGRTLAVVADVSGHNLASGMVMVGARSALRLIAARLDRPSAVFESLLAASFDDLQRTELFVSAAAVALEPGSGTVEIVNAGHNDVLVCRKSDGAIERHPSAGAVFGFRLDEGYAATTVELRVGDVALIYTDGLVEACDATGEMFGDSRLEQVLSAARRRKASGILDTVRRAVSEFSGRSDPEDDVTAVVIKRNSAGARKRGRKRS